MISNKKESRVLDLICACCGKYTRARQWWNQDNGYGICSSCVDFCKSRTEDFEESYGKDGIHFNIEYKNRILEE